MSEQPTNPPAGTPPTITPPAANAAGTGTRSKVLGLVAGVLAVSGLVTAVLAFTLTDDEPPATAAAEIAEEPVATPDTDESANDESAATPDTEKPNTDEADTDEPTTEEPVREPTAAEPAVEEPVTREEPVEQPEIEQPEGQPVQPAPEVVVGQDDDGEDIVVVFEISKACGTTHHQPLGSHPSYIEWVLDAPGLADGTPVEVLTSDGATFNTVVAGRRVVVEQGIDRYGDYLFPAIGWIDGDGHEHEISLDGTHVVDEREGKPSETCLG